MSQNKNVEPTPRQRRAFDIYLKGKNKSMRNVMLKAGYSEATAVNPSAKLISSIGWQKLLDKYLPEKMIAERHRQLLDKKELVIRNNNKTGKLEVLETGQIDAQAVSKALDMYYKLKGTYAPEKNINANITLEDLLNENLRRKHREWDLNIGVGDIKE